MAPSFPDLRYETARDHLLQALAILPVEGNEVIRLLIEEASRRCEAKAYPDATAIGLVLPDSPNPPDTPAS